ncbi:MAG: 6-pyruvoyl trahydropterin synthase family protein [Planctomycetota bacterium]|jgi:6-pyruvoyltetrahydropterin/6-carboxytetrahydropterin synthase
MVYRAAVTASYDSALFIPGDVGSSGRTHGHGYKVEAVLEAEDLDGSGFVADFERAQPLLDEVAAVLDHRLLNELEPFADSGPSAERQAEYFFQRLSREFEREFGGRVRLAKIRVTQIPGAWAEYEA